MNASDRRRLLGAYPVLREMRSDLLRKLEETATPLEARQGQRLFADGSPCTAYVLVLDGTVRVSKGGADGQAILLYRLNPGESCVLTVAALLGDTSYSAIGTAETAVSLFAVPRSVFLDMVLASAPFRAFVFSSFSQRIAHLMTLVDDIAFRRMDQRLASLLLLRGPTITATHQMLADELGTTREVVSRILEAFQQSGLLSLGRKRIEVLDRGALLRVHDGEPHQRPSSSR